jgi:hypothetical protein
MRVGASLLTLGGLALAFLLSACGDGRSYPADRSDEEYDLGAMALHQEDLPGGFDAGELDDPEFDNARWVDVFDTDDPEGKLAQLDAQGRLRSYVSAFQPGELGRIFSITAVSTLYTDVDSAKRSAAQYGCGLPIDDKVATTPFDVPRVGDDSTGFFIRNESANGLTTVDTNLCFRTGRVLHAIQQTGLPGTEDVALAVRLAERWLTRIDDAFDGKTEPPTADETPAGG